MRKKLLIIPKQIITANNNNDILRNFAIEITDGRISRIDLINNFDTDRFDGTVKNYNNLTLIPGFVQTHVHLCQTLFRGMADDLELLDWLKKYGVDPRGLETHRIDNDRDYSLDNIEFLTKNEHLEKHKFRKK